MLHVHCTNVWYVIIPVYTCSFQYFYMQNSIIDLFIPVITESITECYGQVTLFIV